MNRCDDCGREYDGAPYYTFEADGCVDHHDCTGNLCPYCAGPFIEPDDPDDPRRPID